MPYSLDIFPEIQRAVETSNKDFLLGIEGKAIDLLDVLGSTEAKTRDQIGWSTLSMWFRSEFLSPQMRRTLCKKLISADFLFYEIDKGESDSTVRRSFSALTLADLVAGDAKKPALSNEEFIQVAQAAMKYLLEEKDRRGHVEHLGWVHACAHCSDLLRELGQHPKATTLEKNEMVQTIINFLTKEGFAVFKWDEDNRLGMALAVLVEESTEPLKRFENGFLYETPARQNILTTLRVCYLELLWKDTSASRQAMKAIEPLIRG